MPGQCAFHQPFDWRDHHARDDKAALQRIESQNREASEVEA
jgi:hypothetical protein